MTDIERLTEAVLELWRRLRRAGRAARRAQGIGLEQYALLKALEAEGAATIGHLAARMGVTSSAMTTAAKRLEAQALVRRERRDRDQRLVHVVLTPAGREAVGAFQRARRAIVSDLATRLGPDEQAQLAALLERMLADGGTDDERG